MYLLLPRPIQASISARPGKRSPGCRGWSHTASVCPPELQSFSAEGHLMPVRGPRTAPPPRYHQREAAGLAEDAASGDRAAATARAPAGGCGGAEPPAGKPVPARQRPVQPARARPGGPLCPGARPRTGSRWAEPGRSRARSRARLSAGAGLQGSPTQGRAKAKRARAAAPPPAGGGGEARGGGSDRPREAAAM